VIFHGNRSGARWLVSATCLAACRSHRRVARGGVRAVQTVFQFYIQDVVPRGGHMQTFDAIAKDASAINKAAFMKCCKVA
jgi:hypothetical protein